MIASCLIKKIFLYFFCLEFGKKLIKNLLHTEQLLQPLRGYLLVREEKATRSLSEEIEGKIAAPKSFGIMSDVTVNISQTTECCASQQQGQSPCSHWFSFKAKVAAQRSLFVREKGYVWSEGNLFFFLG